MIGFSRSSFKRARPRRVLSPTQFHSMEMLFSGQAGDGTQANETRTLTGFVVTNSGDKTLGIEVESEETKESFSAVVQPGETVNVPISAFELYWNTNRRIVGWDGLNIRTREPA